MADIAREAGVSLMTVSRVINHKDGISEATRQRVQTIIDRMGYRPSHIARGLATDRTGTIGLVVPDNANPFFSEVARGVEHVAYDKGYNVFLCNTDEDTGRELAVLRSLEEKRVDGVVLCSSRLAQNELHDVIARHAAVVLINRASDLYLANGKVGTLLIADETGASMVTRHLIQSGHRAIGYLAGPQRSYSQRQRAKGFQTALATAGLPYRPEWSPNTLPVVEAGQDAARELLTAHPRITALVCYNDLVAVGALQACQELGRAVPDDVAVTGFDDIPLAALVTPALTTCRVDKYGLGSQAMTLLLDIINNCAPPDESVHLQPELIVRASAP